LFFILTNPGIKAEQLTDSFFPTNLEYASFIEDQLKNNNSVWSICSWSKNMNTMQLGKKIDTTGWEVYNACKDGGAIIATAHEHSYHRTKTLIDIENQIVDPDWSNPNELRVKEGSTFVFVSGIGGHSIRDQERCLPYSYPYGCNDEWAKIYTSNQDATFGSLFCDFNADGNPNKAYCYFKNIDGEIVDEFNITNFVESDTVTTKLSEVDSLKDYLSKKEQIEIDFTKTNLSNMDLSNVDLSNVVLTGKDLSYANLSGQNLSNHDLTDTKLLGADLRNSILPDSGLSGKDFSSALFDGVDLSGKDLTISNFTFASFDNANMENADLESSSFFGVDFTKIKNKSLAHADLTNASFAYSNLSGVDLTGSVIVMSNFNNADLSDLDFTNIYKKSIVGSIFTSANISNTTFEGVDFHHDNFFEWWFANMGHLNNEMEMGMKNRFIEQDAFYNKWIIDSHVVKPTILDENTYLDSDGNIELADNYLVLTYVLVNDFYNANLENVNFSNAILAHTNFSYTTLKNVDLTDANLTAANFNGYWGPDTNFDGAIIDSKEILIEYWSNWLSLPLQERIMSTCGWGDDVGGITFPAELHNEGWDYMC